jgi:hypothetical protein
MYVTLSLISFCYAKKKLYLIHDFHSPLSQKNGYQPDSGPPLSHMASSIPSKPLTFVYLVITSHES